MTHERQNPEHTAPSSVIDAPQAFLSRLIWAAVQGQASDIHLRTRNHPLLRIDGRVCPAREFPVLRDADLRLLAKQMMSARHWSKLEEELQVDFSVGV